MGTRPFEDQASGKVRWQSKVKKAMTVLGTPMLMMVSNSRIRPQRHSPERGLELGHRLATVATKRRMTIYVPRSSLAAC